MEQERSVFQTAESDIRQAFYNAFPVFVSELHVPSFFDALQPIFPFFFNLFATHPLFFRPYLITIAAICEATQHRNYYSFWNLNKTSFLVSSNISAVYNFNKDKLLVNIINYLLYIVYSVEYNSTNLYLKINLQAKLEICNRTVEILKHLKIGNVI